jgi:large subunit ribosomal protein L9
MIADEIRIQFGIEVDRRHVMLEEPIKHLGEFTVPLRASADVTGEVKVVVEAEVKREEIEQRLIEQARADDEAAKAEAEEAAKTPEAAEEAASAADVHEKYEAHEETTTEES